LSLPHLSCSFFCVAFFHFQQVKILETYFGAEEEEDEGIAPEANAQSFGFGTGAPPPSGGFNFGGAIN
jgi:hypothetical protein